MKKKEKGWIGQEIKSAGYKQTPSRTSIFSWLEKHKGIFSAKEILEANTSLDSVSVYRTLELLTKLDIIDPLMKIDDHQYYELHEEQHHHHAVCRKCKKAACIGCPGISVSVKGFSDIHHSLAVTGLCTSCAK